jgi:hypothetical protein
MFIRTKTRLQRALGHTADIIFVIQFLKLKVNNIQLEDQRTSTVSNSGCSPALSKQNCLLLYVIFICVLSSNVLNSFSSQSRFTSAIRLEAT